MELHRFLSLLATLIGLIGAAFVAKGIVILSPEEMIRSTTHYSAMAWPSKRIITSMSTDQADTLVGFIFVFLACLIQAIAIFVNEEVPFCKSSARSVMVAFVFVLVLIIMFYFVNKGIRDYDISKMQKYVIKDYCTERFIGRSVDRASAQGLEDMISEYLPELERKDSESQKDFIKRIADYASCILPNNTDFSSLEESRLKR